jgi:DNA-binding MarR family transcriptional regulator
VLKKRRMFANGISDADYRALAEFRYQIRRFLRVSERAAREAGIEPQQHQLLLAIKGLPSDHTATVGEIAERLQIQHHSAVELINRSERRGVIRRTQNQSDRRLVVVELTAKGERLLRDLSVYHRTTLQSFALGLVKSLEELTVGNARRSRSTSKRKPNSRPIQPRITA